MRKARSTRKACSAVGSAVRATASEGGGGRVRPGPADSVCETSPRPRDTHDSACSGCSTHACSPATPGAIVAVAAEDDRFADALRRSIELAAAGIVR